MRPHHGAKREGQIRPFQYRIAMAIRAAQQKRQARRAIIAPSGEVAAQCVTLEDELAVADCNLDQCHFGKQTVFDFARHRRIEHYGLITEQTGVVLPDMEH